MLVTPPSNNVPFMIGLFIFHSVIKKLENNSVKFHPDIYTVYVTRPYNHYRKVGETKCYRNFIWTQVKFIRIFFGSEKNYNFQTTRSISIPVAMHNITHYVDQDILLSNQSECRRQLQKQKLSSYSAYQTLNN